MARPCGAKDLPLRLGVLGCAADRSGANTRSRDEINGFAVGKQLVINTLMLNLQEGSRALVGM